MAMLPRLWAMPMRNALWRKTMWGLSFRYCCVGFAAAGLMGLSGLAHAEPVSEACQQALAGNRVTIVVPYQPGGGYDTYARILGRALEEKTQASVAVSNMPGAEGQVAARAVANAQGDMVVGFFSQSTFTESELPGGSAGVGLDHLYPIGALNRASLVLIGGKSLAFPDLRDASQPYLIASMASDPIITLFARATGIPMRMIKGYQGSGEGYAALMRGEIDLTAQSLSNAVRNLPSFEELEVKMLFVDGESYGASEYPHFMGAGGYMEQVIAPLDDVEARQRQLYAELVVALSDRVMTVMLPQTMPEPLKVCLEEGIQSVIFDPSFADTAHQYGLTPLPMTGEDVRAHLHRVETLIEENHDILRDVFEGEN